MKTKLLFLTAAILMIVACGKKSGTNTDPKQKEETKDTVDSLKSDNNFVQMPTDDEFYEGMLKIFCKRNYQAKFKKQFKGLVLEDLVLNNDSTAIVSGPLIFSELEKGDTIMETEFKATIIRVGKDKYKITFENKGEKEWNDTTLTINYIQMNKNKAKP